MSVSWKDVLHARDIEHVVFPSQLSIAECLPVPIPHMSWIRLHLSPVHKRSV